MFWLTPAREKRVVPLRVLVVTLKVQSLHLLLADLHSSLIAAPVENRFDTQPLVCFRGADHVYDGLEADQRFSFPVHADEGKHPVLDLVPLARPWWIVAHHDLQPRLIAELL